jgi:hypothetical protein
VPAKAPPPKPPPVPAKPPPPRRREDAEEVGQDLARELLDRTGFDLRPGDEQKIRRMLDEEMRVRGSVQTSPLVRPWALEEAEARARGSDPVAQQPPSIKTSPLVRPWALEEADAEARARGSDPVASSSSGPAAWLKAVLRMCDTDATRIEAAFQKAGFAPGSSVIQVDKHVLRNPTTGCDVEWHRLKLQGFAIGQDDSHSDAWEYRGFHCTDTRGAVGILGQRAFRKSSFEGIYALMCQNPKHMQEVIPTATKCAYGKKNFCDCMFEVYIKSRSERISSGGTAADDAIVADGKISHYKTQGGGKSKEDRWQLPIWRTHIVACWITANAFQDFFTTAWSDW